LAGAKGAGHYHAAEGVIDLSVQRSARFAMNGNDEGESRGDFTHTVTIMVISKCRQVGIAINHFVSEIASGAGLLGFHPWPENLDRKTWRTIS
jgi:hypothetical protein